MANNNFGAEIERSANAELIRIAYDQLRTAVMVGQIMGDDGNTSLDDVLEIVGVALEQTKHDAIKISNEIGAPFGASKRTR